MSQKFNALGIFPGREGYHNLVRTLAASTATSVLVEPRVVKLCDTDRAVMSGTWAGAPGADGKSLVTGHETVVVVKDILGDRVTGIEKGGVYMRVVREPIEYPTDGTVPPVDMMALGFPWKEAGIHGEDGGLVPQCVVDYRALVPVPTGLPLELAPFIETASCPLKALRLADGIRRTLTADFGEDPLPKTVLIPGGAGKSGGIVLKMFERAGFTPVVIGRAAEGSRRVDRLTSRGIAYRQFSDRPGFADSLKAEFGPARYVFDLTGNGEWMDVLQLALGHTGGVIQYAIPDRPDVRPHDLTVAGRDAVLANKFRLGSVNANPCDWLPAGELVKWIHESDPAFLTDGLRRVDGLDLDGLIDALDDPEAIYPVVFPNGIAAAAS